MNSCLRLRRRVVATSAYSVSAGSGGGAGCTSTLAATDGVADIADAGPVVS